ncbi:Protein NUCLEAR FUSION DEFECTIVE 6, mitochondrial-like [Zea mays]|uniref:Uncharacterized protein n=1 Tax=Zea mays TaxID=4577 RepID=B6SX18_MAIZE|nr:Protein NUCLEAR FUSION DEFECTIVE 6, mitochondrial-like [Zea mays]ACG29401.1 hypothetical protein [Zea mays]AQK73258.1 hypothetical protein ZEAMMB73_Zm00001d017491 [Zea mays]|eukprot:NP_001143157.1 uncharacterized protein LOC100275638 [Zea mays]
MASTCFRAAARVASAASRSAAAYRSAPSAARAVATAAHRISCFSRVPVELGCCAGLSLLPLHSAVASARLTSRLSTASSCRALSQQMGQSVRR